MYFPIEKQILHLLDRHFNEIVEHLQREHTDGVISDIDDGEILKKLKKKYPHVHVLSLSLNTDGANVFKSSKGSLWPVQLYANFLPPKLRYLKQNIILSTIYYGKKKPDIMTLFYALASEFDKWNENVITVYKNNEFWNFKPNVSFGIFDLPAPSEVQAFKGPTGKSACPFCYHSGIPVRNLAGRTTIRYVSQPDSRARNHGETILIAQRVSNENSESIDGVKGHCAMLLFSDIDVINSLPIDYMHGILLGLTKNLIEIWLGKKRIPTPPYGDYKIKQVASKKTLEQRILKMKPTINFSRKPRSIFEIENFKASELMYCLFYYLRYSLVGLLPTRVIKHFEKLSAATYILCKDKISTSEVRQSM